MSHYTVLVIGPDVDKQLAPFHEFECTGTDDEFVQDIDVTAECIEHGVDYYGLAEVASEAEVDRAGKHKYGYVVVSNGVVAKAINRTNPDKKWDWYQVGGRWTGKLLLKDRALGVVGRGGLMTEPAAPGYADQARKGDIDLEQMRNDAGAKAHALWRSTREITGGQSWETWEDTRLRYPDIAQAREEYHSQPAIEMLKASGNKAYQWDLDDDLSLDEDVFVARMRSAACAFFAYLKDGQWEERGRMGWFASVSDGVSEAQWQERFNRMLDALPDDALLTVVDCHI